MKPPNIPIHIFHWGPCVVRFKISEKFHKDLLEQAYISRSSNKDYRFNLAGHIKEEYAMDRAKFETLFTPIFHLYHGAWKSFTGDKKDVPVKYLLKSIWVNFQKQYEYNPPHDHSEALSFVIYLKIPEALKKENKEYVGTSRGPGSIMFTYGEGGRNFITYQSHFPEERDIFVFPASLKHSVAPFVSPCERISVSGNALDSIPLTEMPKDVKYEVVQK